MADDQDDDRPMELPITTSKTLRKQQRNKTRQNVIKSGNPSSKPDQQPIATPRDPRFDPRCSGSDDRRHFVRNYSFLNEVKQSELKELQKALKIESDPEKKDEIKRTISRYRNKMIEPDRQFNAKKARGRGKKVELAEKFKDLKETGKLPKYLERKRKKLLKRDQKSFG